MQVLLAYGLREPLQASLLAATWGLLLVATALEASGRCGRECARCCTCAARSPAWGRGTLSGGHTLLARHVALELSAIDVAVRRLVWL